MTLLTTMRPATSFRSLARLASVALGLLFAAVVTRAEELPDAVPLDRSLEPEPTRALAEFPAADWPVRYLLSAAARASAAATHARPPAARYDIEHTTSGSGNFLVNSKLGDGAGSAQVEPSVAMLGPFVVCAWNTDKLPSGGEGMMAASSASEGTSWTPAPLPPPGGPSAKWLADPVVVVNEKTADFWFSGIFSPSGSATVSDGIAVVHGKFEPGPSGFALTWSPPVVVRSGLVSALIFDKDWLAADSSNGNLYLTYTVFATGVDSILFQKSSDGGATWSTPLTLAAASPGLLQGSRVAVGPAGEVYAAWFHAGGPPDAMELRKSSNAGVSFAPKVTVATPYSNFGSGGPGSNLPYAPNYPSLAVDRSLGNHRGRIYMAWAEAAPYTGLALGTGGDKSEVAPSGGVAHATPFTPGMTLRGLLTPGDVDTWSFTVDPSHTVVFSVDSLATGMGAIFTISCGDTTLLQFSGGVPPAIGSGKPNLSVFSPSMPGPYFLKLAHTTSGVAGYRIKTGTTAFPPVFSGHGFDDRDVMVATSDGGTIWGTPVRVNSDAPGADQVMPEVAVSNEGYAYASWFDYAGGVVGPCAVASNIASARSPDGGATWLPAATPVSSTSTTWAHVASDIVPNQGDYLGLHAGTGVAYAYTDGRLGDPDIFFSSLHTFWTISCPLDSAITPGDSRTLAFPVTNANELFAGSWNWTLTSERSWPGLPATGTVTIGPLTGDKVMVEVTVPDSAAAGVNHLCFHLVQPNAAKAESCCVADTVKASLAAVGPGPRPGPLALSQVWPNPAPGAVSIAFTLASGEPAVLELLDLAGRRVLSRAIAVHGSGAYQVSLGPETRALPVGSYVLRLSQGERHSMRRIAILH